MTNSFSKVHKTKQELNLIYEDKSYVSVMAKVSHLNLHPTIENKILTAILLPQGHECLIGCKLV